MNVFINPDYCMVHYTPFDEVLEMIAYLGTDPHLILQKIDVQSSFCLLPVYPSDQKLIGFKLSVLL